MDVKMCRVCLAQDVKLYDICVHNLKTSYERLTNHMVANDGLRHTLCWECSARLRSCDVFRDKALRSQAMLSAMAPFDKQDISKKLQSIDRQEHKLISTLSVSVLLNDSIVKCEIWSDTNNAQSSIEQVIKQERDSASEESETAEYIEFGVMKCEPYSPDMLDMRIGQPQDAENPASTSVQKPIAEKVANISQIEENLQAPKTAKQKGDLNNESSVQPISNKPNVPVKKTNEEPKTVLTCDQCKENFNSKTDLLKHVRAHSLDNKKTYGALTKPIKTERQKTETSFDTNSELAKHLYTKIKKRNLAEKSFKCKYCNYACSQKIKLSIHERVHTEKKPYKCVICDYGAAQSSHLKAHVMSKHAGVKPFKCSYCNYASSYKNALSTHTRKHTGEKPYKCEICGYRAARTDTLKTHVISEHAGEKPFKCNYCNYASGIKSHLSTHERTHSGEKPYKCDICDYKTAHSNNLKMHVMRKHAGEKPFKCIYCNYASSYKHDLSTHTRKHTGEKPYKCNICDYKAAQSSQLKRHVMSKHAGVKPFKCSHCNYASGKKSYLSTHERTHSGEKPYKCDCDYKTAYSNNLKQHLMRIHAGVKP